jgi:DNA modification methylase
MGIAVLNGDCRELLDAMPAASVQCCVTSPPYFGLRDYGVRGQIGLEPTTHQYIAEMVAVFRKVRRVLRDDGTLWLNLGDSYAGSWGNYGGQNRGKPGGQWEIKSGSSAHQKSYDRKEKWRRPTSNKLDGLKSKDLMMIPARVELALQAGGRWPRSDIIWHKPNPMPESVTDRPTCTHEHPFLLTKSAKYFYDADAIREPLAATSISRLAQNLTKQAGSDRANGGTKSERPDESRRAGRQTERSLPAPCRV